MAINEVATAKVNLDGQQADNQLQALRARARSLKKELDKLRLAKDPNFAKKKREYDNLSASIRKASRSTFDLSRTMRNLSGSSLKELTRAQRQLNAELRVMDRSTVSAKNAFRAKSAQLKQVQQQIKLTTNEMRGFTDQRSRLERFATGFSKYFSLIATGAAALTGVIMVARKAITMFAEFDDKVADAMKVTKMSREEIYDLNEAFKEINTRTAQEDLMDLAWVAGKLGISGKKDVEAFVTASEKIAVALKKDLGGSIEETLKHIGKLVDIFDLADKYGLEDAILKTGSAINELGMSSTAAEAYLINFTKRAAGIAPVANISIANVLGFAATLDTLGQQAETSSTVYTMLISNMHKRTEKFAAVAGKSLEDFNKLLTEDANEAMLQVLEGLAGKEGAMDEMVKNLVDIGMEGRRATAVMGALANGTHKLRAQQALANDAFDKGYSIQNEYNIKNNTALAMLEKRRKGLANTRRELGERLLPLLAFSTKSATYFVKALVEMFRFFDENKKVIVSLTFSFLAYSIQVKAAALATKLFTMATWKAVKAKLALIKISKLNPWGLALAALVGLVTWIRRYRKELNSTTALQKEMLKVDEVAIDMANKELLVLKDLFDRLKLLNKENRDRSGTIMEINEKYGRYLPNLIKENDSVRSLQNSYELLTQAVKDNAMEESLRQSREAIFSELPALLTRKRQLYAAYKELTGADGPQEFPMYGWEKTEDGKKQLMSPLNPVKVFKSANLTAYIRDINAEISANMDLYKKVDEEYRNFWLKLDASRQEYVLGYNESMADQISGDTIDELNKKFNLYQEALKFITIGSKDYLRVQGKMKEVRSQIIAAFGEEEDAAADLTDAYDELSQKISAAQKAIAAYVASGNFADAKKENAVLKNLEASKLVIDGIIAAGGDVTKFLDDLSDSTENEIDETAAFNEKFAADWQDTFDAINEEKERAHQEELDRIQEERDARLNADKEDLERKQRARDHEIEQAKNVADAKKQITDSVINAGAQIYFDQLRAQTDAQLASLDRRRDAELSNENLTSDQREAIQEKYRKQEVKIKTDEFKKQKRADIILSIINTALAVTRALPNIPLSIAAGIAGAAQTAVIAAQPVPQFFAGRYDVIGADDGAQYNNVPYTGAAKTGIYKGASLVSDKGDELIVDGDTTRKLIKDHPDIIQRILSLRTAQYAGGNLDAFENSVNYLKSDVVHIAPEFPHAAFSNLINWLNDLLLSIASINFSFENIDSVSDLGNFDDFQVFKDFSTSQFPVPSGSDGVSDSQKIESMLHDIKMSAANIYDLLSVKVNTEDIASIPLSNNFPGNSFHPLNQPIPLSSISVTAYQVNFDGIIQSIDNLKPDPASRPDQVSANQLPASPGASLSRDDVQLFSKSVSSFKASVDQLLSSELSASVSYQSFKDLERKAKSMADKYNMG